MEERSTVAEARMKPLNIPENKFNVSSKKQPNFYVFLGKKLL